MSYYSFNRPQSDGRLSWLYWLTDSGRFTHKVVTWPSTSLAQDKESSTARIDIITTMLHHQLVVVVVNTLVYKYICLSWAQLPHGWVTIRST